MAGTSATYDLVDAQKVQTQTLSINDVSVIGISTDWQENSFQKLTTAHALYEGLSGIQGQVDVLNRLGLNVETIVISPPLVSPIFADTGYELFGWSLFDQVALYIGDVVDNYIKIPNTLFANFHHYLINIKVHTLPNGRLELRNKDGEAIAVITTIGDYYFDVYISDSDSFKIVAAEVEYGKQVTISYLAVHRISDQFYNYLANKIKELSSVDGQGYVDKALFEVRMDEIENMILDSGTALNNEITNHLNDKNNPHGVTPALINAADKIHGHDDLYFRKNEINDLLVSVIASCAPKTHQHLEYVTQQVVNDYVKTQLDDTLKTIHTVSPLCLLDGPSGMLPEIFVHSGMTPPSQVLISNIFNHDPKSAYDITSGFVSCNTTPITNTIMDAFSRFSVNGKLAIFHYDYTMPEHNRVFLHYQFHRKRKLIGYKVRGLENGFVKKWSLYSNFNTFIHTVQNTTYQADGFEIMMATSVQCSVISFEIIETSDVNWGINIEPIFEDIASGHIGITEEPILLSIPRGGNNLIFTLDFDTIKDISPEYQVEQLPLYVYLDIDSDNTETIGCTYIPPEYGTICRGIDIFRDRYAIGLDITNPQFNDKRKLIHPIFGTLELFDCNTYENLLETIYNTEGTWTTPESENTIRLVHTFPNPVHMVGYNLEWDISYLGKLPTDWSMYLTVIKPDLSEEILVVDSITTFGSKYNYDNSMIVYYKKFQEAYLIKSVELDLNNQNGTGIALTNFKPMITHDFYSVPKNTMYCGNEVVTRMYLGVAEFHDGDFKINSQLTIGKTCHVPINNLETTSMGSVYRVVNPFHTTDVSCSVRVVSGDLTNPPICSIVDIKEDVITIISYSSHKFMLTIVRNW